MQFPDSLLAFVILIYIGVQIILNMNSLDVLIRDREGFQINPRIIL